MGSLVMFVALFLLLSGPCHADLLLGGLGLDADPGQEDDWAKSEVVDLQGKLNCAAPPAFPAGKVSASGLSSPGAVLVCGGQEGAEFGGPGTQECYAFTNNTWVKQRNMTAPRWMAGSAYFPQGFWWVGGGMHEEKVLSSTEILSIDDGVWQES